MTGAQDHIPDDIATAGEYVLRLLSAEDEAAFAARLREEPDLRRLVSEWEQALVPLFESVSDVVPPDRVLSRIEADIFKDTAQPAKRRRWFGLPTALVSMAVAAAIAAFVIFNPVATQAPTHRAEIIAEDNSLIIRAQYDAEAGTLDLARIAGNAPTGRVLELWLIEEGAPGPVSLGVIDDAEMRLTVPEDLRTALRQGTLAVSEEPPGGSTTGAPTGAVLALGPVVEL